jgi:glycosyltransferase involved in cell wall biosynthesis
MKLSFIIPAYNVGETLERTLRSVLRQSAGRGQYEILLIDDASTDGTWAAAQECAARHPELRLFRNEQNKGQGASRNAGILAAKGKYIAFVDAADLLHSNAVEYFLQYITQYKSDVIYGNILCIDIFNNTLTEHRRDTIHKNTKYALCGEYSYCIFSAIYRKEFLTRNFIHFSEEIYYGDVEFFTHCILAAKNISTINFPLYTYYIRYKSTATVTSSKNIDDNFFTLSKIYALLHRYNVVQQHLEDWKILVRKFITRLRDADLPISTAPAELWEHCRESIATAPELIREGMVDDALAVLGNYPPQALTPPFLMTATAGSVVIMGGIDYHLRHFARISKELDILGVKHIIIDVSGSLDFSTHRPLSTADADLFIGVPLCRVPENGYVNLLFPAASAYLVATDGGMIGNVIHTAKALCIPTIGFYEGINDDNQCEPNVAGNMRLPYRNFDELLLPGEYYRPIYAPIYGDQRIHVVGLPTARALLDTPPVFPDPPLAVINCNFSYGVLENKREEFMESAVQACRDAGIAFAVSQHPADRGDLTPLQAAPETVYALMQSCSLLISRFSTCILEALSMGKPVIYHNPHGEKFPKFQEDPMGAYAVTRSTKELAAAIRAALADIDAETNFRARSKDFLQHHATLFSHVPPERLAAEAVRDTLEKDRPNVIPRLLLPANRPISRQTVHPLGIRSIEEEAKRLAGREVYFWGCGSLYSLRNHLFAKSRPRCVLVDIERENTPQYIDGLPIKHPRNALPGGDVLPIVIFIQDINAVYRTIREHYPQFTDLVFCNVL